MSQINASSIYLLVLFILPGFLAYTVSISLYRKSREIRDIEVTYKSFLYSFSMYVLLYVFFEAIDRSLVDFAIKHPVISVLIMTMLSICWGIITFSISSNDLLYKLLSKTGLTGKAQPPNLYAALIDPKYQPKAKNGVWIVYTKTGVTREGWVEYTDLKASLVYVTEIKEFDEEGNLIRELPETYGIMLDLSTLEGFEIVYCE